METEANHNFYSVKTSSYEGPFNLLLLLIEERKLFVSDVSLATVTEDYLRYVNEKNITEPSELSAFMSVAATLILIKSKSLLPSLDLTEEEKSDISSLEERLRLYEIYTKLSENIASNFGKKIIFEAEVRKNDVLVFLPDNEITPGKMMAFAADALSRMPKKVFLPEVEVKKVISLEEMIDSLTTRIQNSLKMSFKDFAGNAKTREEKVVVVVGFLAILELVKQGLMRAEQEDNFSDILIEKETIILSE